MGYRSAICVCDHRHCEPTGRRKAPPADRLREAIHSFAATRSWIASSQVRLAMTTAQQKKRGGEPAPLSEPMRRKLLADGGGSLRAVRLLLDDAGRLATQTAQVIQLGAAHLAAAHHGDRVDHRRHYGEYAFHAFAVGNLAHGEAFIEPAAGAADADAFIGLHARAVAFD